MTKKLKLAPGTDHNANLSVSIFADKFAKTLSGGGYDRSHGMSSSPHQSSRYMSQRGGRRTSLRARVQNKITEAMEDDINSRVEEEV